jgi:adenylate cyclase
MLMLDLPYWEIIIGNPYFAYLLGWVGLGGMDVGQVLYSVIIGLVVLIILFFLRQLFFQRVEELANIRVERALKVKEKALRIRSGLDSEMVGKSGGREKVKSIKYKSVTVLFADIQGFTKIVEHLNPDSLIDELDHFFFRFDSIVEKHGIEKIKTIGDAYMAAGGIPDKSRIHSVKMVLVAMEIHDYMFALRAGKIELHQDFWELRVGIHTGPVIAGRVGRNKTSLDIWGDTVNIASRMESSGVPGEINITGTTYLLVKGFFVCEYRGKMPIKYKGEIDMYFVKGIIPELSIDGEGKVPNELFHIRLQHIRFSDLEEAIMERLENELPKDIYYHNVKHTIDVVTQAEIIARGEGVSEEELLLLKTAALMHDTGFILSYDKHEQNSIDLSREVLRRFDYSEAQIRQVVELIEVTHPKAKPVNTLQYILKDADLDYLGRSDFIKVSDHLFHELQEYNGKMSSYEWNKKQFDFLSKHKYYTDTARKMRQVNKDKQLEKLKIMTQVDTKEEA